MKKQREATPESAVRLPSLPAGERIYAIGDIHGRADLLGKLIEIIQQDMTWGDARNMTVVFLGDYIDRGAHSRDVLDLLCAIPFPDAENVHLIGNHEAVLLQFLKDAAIGADWVQFGGEMTLASYGARLPRATPSEAELRRAQETLQCNLPEAHISFLRNLKLTFRAGDYLFVHAGIRPGIPLEQQNSDDLIWIRRQFIDSEADHGHVIVHGHTPDTTIQSLDNRIGIDTGAYFSGRLTAVVLEGDTRRFLTT